MTSTDQKEASVGEPGYYLDGISYDLIEQRSKERGITIDEAREQLLKEFRIGFDTHPTNEKKEG